MRNKLAWMICLGSLAMYGLLAASSTLWDRDEPRFARATMEMVESGNYLYPTFNGQLRPDKPIMIYWAMAAFVKVLGCDELAFRAPSIIGMAISCYITFLIGRELFCARTGLWAAVILATSLMAIVEGTAATADGLLLACMMAVIWQYIKAEGRMGLAQTLSMGIALGLALLTKGPVGLLPVLVILVSGYLLRKDRLDTTGWVWHVILACVLATIIFLAWAVPANRATGGLFAKAGLGHHVFGRSIRPLEGHGGRWVLFLPYYIPVAVVFLFPWSIHLPGAISAMIGGRLAGRKELVLLLAWICTVFGIMTIVATKLPHYVLFAWPALAVIVARTLVQADACALAERDVRYLKAGVFIYGPLALGFALGLGSSGWIIGTKAWPGLTAAVMVSLTAAAAIYLQVKGRFVRSSLVSALGTLALVGAIATLVMPALEQVKISPQVAKALRPQLGDEPVATYGYAEPTLNFYLARRLDHLANPVQVRQWFEDAARGVLIIPQQDLDAIQYRYGPLQYSVIASAIGYNYSKGRRMTVLAVRKGSSDG